MKLRKGYLSVMVVVATVLAIGIMERTALAESVERMSIEKLKEILGSPDVVVFDARASRDWSSSETKIEGATRLDADKIVEMSAQVDKTRTVVLYCA